MGSILGPLSFGTGLDGNMVGAQQPANTKAIANNPKSRVQACFGIFPVVTRIEGELATICPERCCAGPEFLLLETLSARYFRIPKVSAITAFITTKLMYLNWLCPLSIFLLSRAVASPEASGFHGQDSRNQGWKGASR